MSGKAERIKDAIDRITALGGAAVVADLLGYDKDGGTQRVHNWLSRGIPFEEKLKRPDLFMRPLKEIRARAKAAA